MNKYQTERQQQQSATIPPHAGAEERVVSEPDDPRVMSAVRHFRIVVRSIQAHSAWVERQCGLSAAQLWALWEVDRDPGLNVSEIARRLSIQPATASNLLDKIENKGLLRRDRAGPDQRVVQLFITDAGIELLDQAPLPAQGALLDALTRLELDRLEELDSGLAALVDMIRIKDEDSALSPMPPEKN